MFDFGPEDWVLLGIFVAVAIAGFTAIVCEFFKIGKGGEDDE